MLQLQPAINLLDARPVHPSLRLLECPAPVHRLCVRRQCKNCSAFLPRTLEEGLFGNFCVVAHEPPANPSHRRLTLAAHVTEGGHSEREEGGGYATYEGGGSSEYRGGERVGGRYGREFG